MKLSTRAHYGLRAVVAIAKLSSSGEPVSVSDVAKVEDLSDTYLEQLMSKLRRAGILRSYRGARGGYELAKDPDDITIADILEAAGEKVIFPDCTEEMGCARAKELGRPCTSSYFWLLLSSEVDKLIQRTTLGDLFRMELQALAEEAEKAEKAAEADKN